MARFDVPAINLLAIDWNRARRFLLIAIFFTLLAFFVSSNSVADDTKKRDLPAAQVSETKSLKQDEACLACHGQAGMKSEKGQDISINPQAHASSAHGILGCQDCHTSIKEFPHPAKVTKVRCATCHTEESAVVPKSIHGTLGTDACGACHGDVHEVIAAAKLVPKKCAECHQQQVKDLQESAHGRAAKSGDQTRRPAHLVTERSIRCNLQLSPAPPSPKPTWR